LISYSSLLALVWFFLQRSMVWCWRGAQQHYHSFLMLVITCWEPRLGLLFFVFATL
jgi:hypothetical protein